MSATAWLLDGSIPIWVLLFRQEIFKVVSPQMTSVQKHRTIKMKYFFSLILVVVASAASAQQMDCYGVRYDYEDNFIRADQVSVLKPSDIHWESFCSDKHSSSKLHTNYPIAECERVKKYEFSLYFQPNSNGDLDRWILWRRLPVEDETWRLYKAHGDFSTPFDASKIIDYLERVTDGFSNSREGTEYRWITTEYVSHTLNFDIKRQKFESVFLTQSEVILGFETNKSSVYDCE